MKDVPGLYLIRIGAFIGSGSLLVASIGGKLYAVSIDQELRDDGWHPEAHVSKLIERGAFGVVGPTTKEPGH